MRTILKYTPPGSVPSMARWLDNVVRNEPLPAAGTVDLLDMRAAGCALMRSTVAGAEAVLTFEWSTDGSGAPDARDAFVQWWAARPGWKFEIMSVDSPPSLGAAAAGEELYGPDINGRPCSPPSPGTLDTPGIEAINGRPCQPPSGGTVHAPAAPSVEDSAESTG
jgi:hypothetical protein